MLTDSDKPTAAPPPPAEPAPDHRKRNQTYFISALISVLILAVIGVIWYRELNAPFEPRPDETIITTNAQLTEYLDRHVPKPTDGDGPYYIPTGVVLQSLEFKGPYTIQASGYVWQRYADSLPATLDKGIVFAESDTTTLNKVYETKQGNETLIGWNFKTTLREQFDYSNYPLDRQLIWLRMWHVDFEKNVYLAPDLAGYTSLEPSTAPGLDPGLVLENWQMFNSYFSYRLNGYNSNFGIQDYQSEVPQPELYFNVSIKRYILSSLVARGLAPLVILIQLFVLVMVIGSDEKRLEQFGVRPGAVIFTCAAFFFAILVAQNALRDELKWYGIAYLETVHVLTYFVILAVSLNAVLLVAFPEVRVLRKDNQWVEALYWPLILGILLVVTLIEFA